MLEISELQSFASDLSDYILSLMSRDNGKYHSVLSGYLHACTCYYNFSVNNDYYESLCRMCSLLARDFGQLPDHIHTRMILNNSEWSGEYLRCLKT